MSKQNLLIFKTLCLFIVSTPAVFSMSQEELVKNGWVNRSDDLTYQRSYPHWKQFIEESLNSKINWTNLEADITALAFAISWHELATAQQLLAAGANANVMTDARNSLLNTAVLNNSLPAIKLLLKYKINPNEGICIEYILKSKHALEIFKLLIAHDININAPKKVSLFCNETCLKLAKDFHHNNPHRRMAMNEVISLLEQYAPFDTANPEVREALRTTLLGQVVLHSVGDYKKGFPDTLSAILHDDREVPAQVKELFRPDALAAIMQDLRHKRE